MPTSRTPSHSTNAPATTGATGGPSHDVRGVGGGGTLRALPEGEPKRSFYAKEPPPKVGARGSFNQARSRFAEAYPDVPLEDPPNLADSFTQVGADPATPPAPHPVRSTFRDILVGIAVIAGGSTLAYFVMKYIKQRELEEQRQQRALEAEFEAAMRQSVEAQYAPQQAANLAASPAVGFPNPAGGA